MVLVSDGGLILVEAVDIDSVVVVKVFDTPALVDRDSVVKAPVLATLGVALDPAVDVVLDVAVEIVSVV